MRGITYVVLICPSSTNALEIPHLLRFANTQVVKACVLLLKHYQHNSVHTNHCATKMLHRIAVDLHMDGLLFQASVFRTFQAVLDDPAVECYSVCPLIPLLSHITYLLSLSLMYHTPYRASVLLKQLPEQGLYWVVCHCLPSSSWGRNLEFVNGAGNSSPTLREGHHAIFNVHQLMPADGTPV